MNINFGTLVAWLSYNVLQPVEHSVGTSVYMTLINKVGTLLSKFSKNNSLHKRTTYYTQVEALNLSKKGNETVRHFALKVQQLVEKGWCNENASTINLKCNEIFTKGLPKNLKTLQTKDK